MALGDSEWLECCDVFSEVLGWVFVVFGGGVIGWECCDCCDVFSDWFE